MPTADPARERWERECPVCGARERRLLFQQRFSTVSQASMLDGYDVVVCAACGCAFADHVPEQAVLDDYYRGMSKYEYQHRGGEESPEDLDRFREISAIIQRFTPSMDARILEIGCATGRLLSLLKNSGFQHVVGLDPSPACAEAAHRLYGIAVLTGALSDVAASSEESFDFLILVGVLEHIRDLGPALTQLRTLLSSRGRIYVEVPDALGFARWLDAPFQQFSIEHINYFSVTALTSLMGRHGFDSVYCRQDARRHSAHSTMPVVSAVYEKSSQRVAAPVRDVETEARLLEYIGRSQALDERVRETIDAIVASREPILVWGVGTHTQRLFTISRLPEANIQAFVDSNPAYHGKQLRGVPIMAPTALRERSEPILISSCVFQAEIEHQMREELNCKNRVIRLYDE